MLELRVVEIPKTRLADTFSRVFNKELSEYWTDTNGFQLEQFTADFLTDRGFDRWQVINVVVSKYGGTAAQLFCDLVVQSELLKPNANGVLQGARKIIETTVQEVLYGKEGKKR